MEATVVDGEVVSIAAAPTRGQSTPYAAERSSFGCSDVERYPPFFSDASHIQGFEDFIGCSNLSSTPASVRLNESRTYGQHAGRITGHAGNADWTAYSQEFQCETQYHRSWQTLATNIYTSGTSATFTGASAWEGGYNCGSPLSEPALGAVDGGGNPPPPSAIPSQHPGVRRRTCGATGCNNSGVDNTRQH